RSPVGRVMRTRPAALSSQRGGGLRGAAASSCLVSHPRATEPHTRSLHAALPISPFGPQVDDDGHPVRDRDDVVEAGFVDDVAISDRKSTRLNSSHVSSSYAVFCLKKKNRASRYGISAPSTETVDQRRVGSSTTVP